MVFFILTGGCVLPKNCARSTSCCQAFTGTAGQYYYHAAFGFHESCQIKILFCQVSVRVYFHKLCESDFGFWGFRILGDFAGGCESGRSSTFLEPRSPPGSLSNFPRVSSCKVNYSTSHGDIFLTRRIVFNLTFKCSTEEGSMSFHLLVQLCRWAIFPSSKYVQNSYLISTEGTLRRPMTYYNPPIPSIHPMRHKALNELKTGLRLIWVDLQWPNMN